MNFHAQILNLIKVKKEKTTQRLYLKIKVNQ